VRSSRDSSTAEVDEAGPQHGDGRPGPRDIEGRVVDGELAPQHRHEEATGGGGPQRTSRIGASGDEPAAHEVSSVVQVDPHSEVVTRLRQEVRARARAQVPTR